MNRFTREKRILMILILVLGLLLCACGSKTPEPAAPSAAPQPEAVPTEQPEAGAQTSKEGSDPKPSGQPGRAEEPLPTAEVPIETAAPERPERVDDSYFADAAFFGNSLVDGLHAFGGLKAGDFYAGTSASVLSVYMTKDTHTSDGEPSTLMEALLEKQYRKIYVMLGVNELGFSTSGFVSLYADLLDDIASQEPDAQICVMSLTPVTEKKSESTDIFTREKVEEFNAAISTMVEQHGYTYLDLYDAMADEEGWLSEEQSTDGVHFTMDKYPEWAEFLRTHALPEG